MKDQTMKTPSEIRDAVLNKIIESHPSLSKIASSQESIIYEGMFSPFEVEIPQKAITQAKNFIHTIFQLRSSNEYLNFLQHEIKQKHLQDPGNKSIFMSYDFHLAADGNLKLIEVNTNAAFLGLGSYFHESQNKAFPISDFQLDEVKSNIETEFQLYSATEEVPKKELENESEKKSAKVYDDNRANFNKTLKSIAIIDENPTGQKLYLEFLLFQSLFRKWGWKCEILDFKDPSIKDYDFIYNRYTDFYLENADSENLRKLFLEKKSCFSPNPFEYFLLADKKRMELWRSADFLNRMPLSKEQKDIILQVVPESYLVKSVPADKVWADRKKMFFKPSNSFGSKQSYKGANISKKVFEDILSGDFLAQEYIPAPEQEFTTPNGVEKFKFDLRCYAYQGRLQMIIARLYQGQVTNSKTPLGGFGLVKII